MKKFQCAQYTPEWWELRCGIPTASDFHRIITPSKGELSKSARGYMCDLAADLAGYHLPNFFTNRENRPKSSAMAVGTETEPEARRYYELHREVKVQQVGFCLSDCGRFGCSPDGIVLHDKEGEGGLELKCPEAATHIEYCLDNKLPIEYKVQVHGQMAVTGWQWIDFMSYVPRLPFNTFLIRVHRDTFTDLVANALEDFVGGYEKLLAQLGLTDNYEAARRNRAA